MDLADHLHYLFCSENTVHLFCTYDHKRKALMYFGPLIGKRGSRVRGFSWGISSKFIKYWNVAQWVRGSEALKWISQEGLEKNHGNERENGATCLWTGDHDRHEHRDPRVLYFENDLQHTRWSLQYISHSHILYSTHCSFSISIRLSLLNSEFSTKTSHAGVWGWAEGGDWVMFLAECGLFFR